MHRVSVHEPRHHLLVGAHIRRHDIGMRSDERNHLLHVTTRQNLQLPQRQGGGVDRDPTFGAAVGQPRQGTFPAHPDRQRRHLADIDGEGEPCAALRRSERQVMLNAIALKHLRGSVVEVDRTGHGDCALRVQQPIPLILRHADMVGDHLELLPRHVEHGSAVDIHCTRPCRCHPGSEPISRCHSALRDACSGRRENWERVVTSAPTCQTVVGQRCPCSTQPEKRLTQSPSSHGASASRACSDPARGQKPTPWKHLIVLTAAGRITEAGQLLADTGVVQRVCSMSHATAFSRTVQHMVANPIS